jgi:hypothetical protein
MERRCIVGDGKDKVDVGGRRREVEEKERTWLISNVANQSECRTYKLGASARLPRAGVTEVDRELFCKESKSVWNWSCDYQSIKLQVDSAVVSCDHRQRLHLRQRKIAKTSCNIYDTKFGVIKEAL